MLAGEAEELGAAGGEQGFVGGDDVAALGQGALDEAADGVEAAGGFDDDVVAVAEEFVGIGREALGRQVGVRGRLGQVADEDAGELEAFAGAVGVEVGLLAEQLLDAASAGAQADHADAARC